MKLKKYFSYRFLLLFVIAVGIVLRIWNYWGWSLSNDELSALSRLNFKSFFELIEFGVKVDGHPAFTQTILYYWVKFWGNTAFSIRFLFVLSGIASLYYFFSIAKKWLGQQRAILATTIFSTSQLFILYSQIARPYSMGILFVLGFTFYWLQLLLNNRSIGNTILFILFGALSLLTHYFSGLMIIVLLIFGLARLKSNTFVRYVIASSAIGLLFLPHLSITLHHLSIGGVGWLPETEWNFLQRFLFELFNGELTFLFIFLFILTIGVYYKGLRIFNKTTFFLFSLFFLPYFIAYFYSIHISPLLQFSVLLFFAPFFILALCSILPLQLSKRILYGLTGSVLLLLLFNNQFLSKKPFANYAGVIRKSIEIEKKIGSENIISIGSFTDSSYAEYYINQFDTSFRFDYQNLNGKSPNILVEELKNSNVEYILVAFANQPLSKETHELIKLYYPIELEKKRYFNSEVIVYSKASADRAYSFQTNFEQKNKRWSIDQSLFQDSVYISSPKAYAIVPNVKYALTYKDSIYNLFSKNNFLSISCYSKSETPTRIAIVTTVKRNGITLFWNSKELNKNRVTNNWFYTTMVLEKTAKYKPDDEVYIYLWNPNQDFAYIDDLKITNYFDSDYNYYEF